MKNDESYGAFAFAYDLALGESFFRAVRGMLDDVVAAFPAETKTHLDLACGTGYAVDYFTRLGYESTGLDASVPMLDVARLRAGRLVAGDMRALPLRCTFGRVTCLYDSLNHLQTAKDLTSAFGAVASVMERDSLFFFDMNHPDIYPAVWGTAEPFVSSSPDHHLEIATQYRAKEKRGIGIVTGWAKMPDGRRVTIDEVHRQRAWSICEIETCAARGGLTVVEALDFDPFQELEHVEAAGVKLFYVCRRAR